MRERGRKRRELICFHKTRVEKKHLLSAPLKKVEMKRRKGFFVCQQEERKRKKENDIYSEMCEYKKETKETRRKRRGDRGK